MLRVGLVVAALARLYTIYTQNHTKDALTVEQAIVNGWNAVIEPPPIQFRKIVVGINCNVDLVVSGTALLRKLQIRPSEHPLDLDAVTSMEELESVFGHSFQYGAAVERYTSNPKVFDAALIVLENQLRHQTESSIGGNAALMAEKLASSYIKAKILLVGPIGPRLKALLHPNIITQNSTNISKDELHIVMEYKHGEIWGENVAPSSNRFITSHDVFRFHFFEKAKDKTIREEKLRLFKRSLTQMNANLPIHLELGSMADAEFVRNMLFRIVPHVDSLGLNEQELSFMSSIAGGPNGTAVSGATHVHKAVEMLHWLITKFGKDKSEPSREQNRLQRIHFHCLTYHLMVSVGSDWSNLAAALGAGVRLAGQQACGLEKGGLGAAAGLGLVELRTADTILLDKEQGRLYELNPHAPITSWMREDVLFIFSPTLVCSHPVKTVGLGDAISATGLAYSQFYRYDRG